MGWYPEAPTNALRVSLVTYLRGRLSQRPSAAEGAALRGWIAWLEGAEVSDEDLARAVRSESYATEV
jgi:hypothetical protein